LIHRNCLVNRPRRGAETSRDDAGFDGRFRKIPPAFLVLGFSKKTAHHFNTGTDIDAAITVVERPSHEGESYFGPA
jgi:hypothetical protein